MSFNYGEGFSFDKLEFLVTSNIKLGSANLSFSLHKKMNSKGGEFSLNSQNLRISDFYEALGRAEATKKTIESSADISQFTALNFIAPTIIGSRDSDGNDELIVSGEIEKMESIWSWKTRIMYCSSKESTQESFSCYHHQIHKS